MRQPLLVPPATRAVTEPASTLPQRQRAPEPSAESDTGSLVHAALATQGVPLSPHVRHDAELRIGASFGNLRIGATSAGSLPSSLPIGAPTSSFETEATQSGASFDASVRGSPDQTSGNERKNTGDAREAPEATSAPRAELGAVRIHRGEEAAAANDAIDANAFAVANHVVLSSEAGRTGEAAFGETLAHELTHVAQQSSQGPSVQCQPAKKKKRPRVEVSKLTDTQKAELRGELVRMAEEGTTVYMKEVEAKTISQNDRAKVAGWVKQLQRAQIAVGKRPAGRDRDVRMNYLQATTAFLSEDINVRYWVHSGTTLNQDLIAKMLNPKDVAGEKTLDMWAADAARYRAGARAMLSADMLHATYEYLGIKEEDLQTEEQTASEAAQQASKSTGVGGSQSSDPNPVTPPKRTVEDRQKLEDLFASLPDATPSTDVGDEDKLLEELKTMDPEQLQKFKDYLASTSRPDKDPKPLSEAAREFKSMSAVDLKVAEVNRDIGEQDTGEKKRLEGPVLLKLKSDAKQFSDVKAKYKQHRANLMRLRASITDKSQIKDFPSLDLDIDFFVNEIAMFEGLMAGGKEASATVGTVVDKLIADLHNARGEIFKQLLNDAAWSLLLSAVPVPGPGLAKLAHTLKKLYDRLHGLLQVYRTGERVVNLVKTIADFPAAYQKFRAAYENSMEVYTRVQAQLEQLDGSDDLEQKLEGEMDKLTNLLEEQLEGKFGDVLEMMYIPEDTTPEQLMKILLDIPRGFDWLTKMWDFYKSPDAKGEDVEEILMVYGFRAGQLLYPFVGLLAAEINDALAAFVNRKSMKNRFDKVMPRKWRKGGKERGRGLFRRRNRKRVKIGDPVLTPIAAEGARELRKLIDDDEPDKQWAPNWFKYTLRRELKTLNQKFATRKVKAKVTQKGGKGQPKVVTEEEVPLPEFRLKFERPKRKQVHAKLKLNPEEPIDRDLLTPDDFSNKGVKYEGTDAKRQDAIRDWLGDAGYQITRDQKGNPHLRLPGGERAEKDKPYLHFKQGRIVEGIGPTDYDNFTGRSVGSTTDLPEGYVLLGETKKKDKTEDAKDAIVQRKAGVADKYNLPQLGLDTNQRLKVGAGDKQPAVLWPAVITECKTEGFNWTQPVQTMFAETGYNDQGKDKGKWVKHVAETQELKRRPHQISGPLGYTLRARAGGDLLGSRHLPELKKRDDKGHLIARRFGGSDSYNNLIPMKRSLNQLGRWYDMEQDMAECFIGSKKKPRKPNEYASFTLAVLYPDLGTRRPNKFQVTWKRQEAKTPQKGDPGKDPASETHTKVFDND